MGRRKNPLSDTQIRLRTKRLADPEHGWRHRVLTTLALAVLRAHGWVESDESVAAPFPALPEQPGDRVRLVAEPLNLNTPEGWAAARAALASVGPADDSPLLQAAEVLAERLAPRLVNELSPAFYRSTAIWIGQMLAAGPQVAASVFSAHTPDLWAVPPRPLALPGGSFTLTDEQALEALAENAACWWAARLLYRTAIDAQPDVHGRRGLERPHLLRTLLLDLGVIEPDGERVGGLETLTDGAPVARMATGLPVPVAMKAMMRPDCWTADDVGGLYSYNHDRGPENKATYELRLQEKSLAERLPEGALFFGLDQCQSILRTRGLDAAALHGVLCTYLAMLPDPTATIELDGRELLKDLGLDTARNGREEQSLSELLKRLGHTATVLMSLVFSSKGNQRDRTGWITTSAGPLWNIGIRTDGYQQQMELDGVGENSSVRDAVIDGLTLTVSGGGWVKSHLNRGALHGGEGRYQFGPVALSVLRLGRYRQELAFRIGMHLSLGFRVWRTAWKDGSCTKKVGTILHEVLPEAEIEKALQDRRYGHTLREQWKAALATLHQCCGFRFEFDPAKYPLALVPDCMRTPEQQEIAATLPHGATDKLLQSYLTIHWPEDVQALRQGAALKAVEERPKLHAAARRPTLLPAPQEKPNAVLLKRLMEQAKRDGYIQNQRDLARIINISQGHISKMARGRKEITNRELVRIAKALGYRLSPRGDGYVRLRAC